MKILLYLAPIVCVLGIYVVHAALPPQVNGNANTDKNDKSLHERLSKIEEIVLGDSDFKKRLHTLEIEFKRIEEENKSLRDVVKNQDSSLKQLRKEIQNLRSDNVELDRFCKENFIRYIPFKEDTGHQHVLLPNQPDTNYTTESGGQKMNINPGGTEGNINVDHYTGNMNLHGENLLLHPLHTRQTQDKRVAFYTTLSTTMSNLGEHQPILFDIVITNIGAAYHPHTGIFTAPVDGVYVFHVCAMSEPRKWQFFELVKDGNFIQSILPDASNIHSHQTDSHTVVLQLSQGNEVWIRTGPTGPMYSNEIHGNGLSSFAGWLLYM
ncbi:hypothetical protein ACJMK2_004319 [Sinanodonta woodiana]|uniref:C1q domain-containing protein n=1 Tax=Sinanodonta woodiana TaxID=1069815 RepID=A0ABD3Y0T0_SINWO